MISMLILLGVLIFVHELGHFLVAKWAGVGVLKFSLGFGPRLIGKKIGETEYIVSMVPLGGYVKMIGEVEGDEEISPSDEKRSFQKQSVLKRFGIVAAGPLSNFLFAIIAFAFIFSIGVPTFTSKIGNVQEGTAAYGAGIKKGDRILAINEREISKWSELAEIVSSNQGEPLVITLEREGKIFSFTVEPTIISGENIFGEKTHSYRIGVSVSDETIIERIHPFKAIPEGFIQTWWWTKITCLSVSKMIMGVISPKTLGGPILIAQVAGERAKEGFLPFVFFMAVLSVNLGVLNLLPIPVLDGGHLLFFVIEMITGKELNLKWREKAQQIGFFLLILLMLFVFYNDIVRIVYR